MSGPLREAIAGLLRVIDGSVSASDAATDIAYAREAMAIEPAYEWSISFGGYEATENRSTYATAEVARAYVDQYGASHVERRLKAGLWERVEG